MSMYSYGIGGNEVKLDASEGIADIPSNRTLMVQKLTDEAPPSPEAEYNCRTVDDVFAKFQPKVEVEFEAVDGSNKKETLAFQNVADFNADQLVKQSGFLNQLELEQQQYSKIAKQLSANKVLQKALTDEGTRAAILQALGNALAELETAK